MKTAAILAMMLSLQKPGVSLFSQVVVDKDSPRACSNKYRPACAKPKYNKYWQAYTRPESWEEGVRRYALIAATIHAISREEVAAARFHGSQSELSRYLVGVAYHESRYRRDIHSGRGPAARGDCKYIDVAGERKRVYGSCRSVCLGQIMRVKDSYQSPRGYQHESLPGVDAAATRRCIETIADHITEAHTRCGRKHGGRASPTCVFGTYGGVPNPSHDERIQDRVKTFRKAEHPPRLGAKARRVAGLPAPPQRKRKKRHHRRNKAANRAPRRRAGKARNSR